MACSTMRQKDYKDDFAGWTKCGQAVSGTCLERSEYPDNARYVRFHSYSKVDGKPIEYSCIGNKIVEGYETRFARLEIILET
mgnify:CR=1 FL=1